MEAAGVQYIESLFSLCHVAQGHRSLLSIPCRKVGINSQQLQGAMRLCRRASDSDDVPIMVSRLSAIIPIRIVWPAFENKAVKGTCDYADSHKNKSQHTVPQYGRHRRSKLDKEVGTRPAMRRSVTPLLCRRPDFKCPTTAQSKAEMCLLHRMITISCAYN